MQSESHVSGATAEIEHTRVWPLQNGRKVARRLPPPPTVHVEREHMIEQIVSWRNGSEHFPHSPCGGRGIACSFGSRAQDSRVDGIADGLLHHSRNSTGGAIRLARL